MSCVTVGRGISACIVFRFCNPHPTSFFVGCLMMTDCIVFIFVIYLEAYKQEAINEVHNNSSKD